MNSPDIFSKIIRQKTSTKIIYQDKNVTAFNDINPKAPVHILIIPNILIKSANDINKENKNIFGHMMYIAIKIAKKLKISNDGYRLIVNCNKHGRQEIPYLHVHLLGGKLLNHIS